MRAAVSAALVLATVLVYADLRHAEFLYYDDDRYVTDNAVVRRGLTAEGARWAFTSTSASNWHPLTWLSHMLDVELFGLWPAAHHAVNVLLHAANAVLLFLLLARATGAPGRSAVVAGLFALHPLHVESVAWIAERKDVLSTLLALAALHAWVTYTRGGSTRAYAASVGLAAGSLLAKPMWVTLPFVLLLLDVWPLRRAVPLRRRLLEKLPFFALALASSAVTFLAQRQGGGMWALASHPPGARLANAAVSYARYAAKLAWPADLAIFYPHPRSWAAWQVAGALLGLVAVTAGAWSLRRRRPYILVGWLLFAGMLVPVIGLVQVGNQSLADRYTYVPAVGLFVAAVWGAADALRGRAARWILPLAAAAALGACAVRSALYVPHWRTTRALFEHALASTGPNPTAENTVGHELAREGRFEEAIPHYEAALRIAPDYGLAHLNLGFARLRTGDLERGIANLRQAAALRPDLEYVHATLAAALERRGDLAGAIEALRVALRAHPSPATRIRVGALRARSGDLEGGLRELGAVVRDHPELAEARVTLGSVLQAAGRSAEAAQAYALALELEPEHPEALRRLGWIRVLDADPMLRNPEEAVRLAERLCARGDPPPGDLDLLAAAHAETGRFDAAVREAGRALELARRGGDAELAGALAARVDLYRAGRTLSSVVEGSAGG